MLSNLQVIGLIVAIIWLMILSVFFWQLYTHYTNLVKNVSSKNLKAILENILKELAVAQKDIENLKVTCDKIEKDGLLHIQKVGLLRFNPFKDTGGDQSFVLSLVDGNDTGVVISGLYSRSGTRWYAKKIIAGKGLEYELSEEEKKAVKEAKYTQ
ncbi:MAG: DUF4446 family protein [bacterium]|nr:DUF4446 family protein [bacterium]